jgi:hypothetical protein
MAIAAGPGESSLVEFTLIATLDDHDRPARVDDYDRFAIVNPENRIRRDTFEEM